VGKLAQAAAALRQFAERYRFYPELAEHLEALGGLVGARERAVAEAAAAVREKDRAVAEAATQRAALDDLIRRYHAAVREIMQHKHTKVKDVARRG
jgi:hypothetical protein